MHFKIMCSSNLSLKLTVLARIEEGRSAFKIVTGKTTGKIPLGRPSRRWEDNIRMGLKETDINTAN